MRPTSDGYLVSGSTRISTLGKDIRPKGSLFRCDMRCSCKDVKCQQFLPGTLVLRPLHVLPYHLGELAQGQTKSILVPITKIPLRGESNDKSRKTSQHIPKTTTAAVTGPEPVDGKMRYTFSRAIGAKG